MSNNYVQTVHEFAKNSTEVVRASPTEFKGGRYAELRVFYQDDDGEYRPTKKGLTVSLDLLDELATAVAKLQGGARP